MLAWGLLVREVCIWGQAEVRWAGGARLLLTQSGHEHVLTRWQVQSAESRLTPQAFEFGQPQRGEGHGRNDKKSSGRNESIAFSRGSQPSTRRPLQSRKCFIRLSILDPADLTVEQNLYKLICARVG